MVRCRAFAIRQGSLKKGIGHDRGSASDRASSANEVGSWRRSHHATVKDQRVAARKHKDELVRCCRSCLVSCRIQQQRPAERRKAASELAQYFLPKNPTQKKSRRSKFTSDQDGFVVDPDIARELRDTKLKLAFLPLSGKKLSPYAFAQKASKLQARIKEIQESLQCPCPSKYQLKHYICVDGREIVVDGDIARDNDRLKILGKRRVDKKIFPPEEDLEEAIRTARHDSFIVGPENAARYRLAELREKKRAADKRYGPPFTPAQDAAFRVLTLLYPPSPNPEPSEIFLADHPFRDLLVVNDDTSSRKAPKRPASTRPQPDSDDDFVEFGDFPPPFCTIDRELSAKRGRTILKWTYET